MKVLILTAGIALILGGCGANAAQNIAFAFETIEKLTGHLCDNAEILGEKGEAALDKACPVAEKVIEITSDIAGHSVTPGVSGFGVDRSLEIAENRARICAHLVDLIDSPDADRNAVSEIYRLCRKD